MNNLELPQSFVSLSDAAYSLGVPMAWLKSEGKASGVPCLKVGKRLMFNLKSVEQALIDRASGEAGRRLTVTLKTLQQAIIDGASEAGDRDEALKK